MIAFVIVVLIISVIYLYHKKKFQYWKKKGVKHDKPILLFGTNTKGYLMQKNKVQMAEEMYWKYPNEKVVGFYRFFQPELIIRDPELIKRVLQNDFQYFFYRGFNPNRTVVEPILKNLFSADGDLWRMMRTTMTPAFTSSKLKGMFPLIIERAEKLQQRTLQMVATGKCLDVKELMARFTTDVIGACAFGLDSDSLNEENSDFRKLGRKIFEAGFKDFVIATLKESFPGPFKNLKYFGKIEKEARELLWELQKARNFEPIGRNDFLDMLLEYKKQGPVEFDSIEKLKTDGSSERVIINFDDDIFMGQIMVFFAAGFETSSNSTSMLLHLLAYHPDIQKKVQEDIDRALNKFNDQLSYDSVKEMTYLEIAFKEALRIFPPLGYISRVCSRQYTFEEIGLTLDKEDKVIIPIQALHMDPKYWGDPENFRPERFLSDEFDKINKNVYLPFGMGPRNCIGSRLGLMQSMAGLAAILSKCTVLPAPESVRYPKRDPLAEIVQSVVGGLPLRFEERKPNLTNKNI